MLLGNEVDLIRWNRPAGWLLLLWPSLYALWIAAAGFPGWHLECSAMARRLLGVTIDLHGVSALTIPYMGYLHTLPRLIAGLAPALLDPAWWPAFYNGISFVIWVAVLARLFTSRFPLPGKPWLAFALIAVLWVLVALAARRGRWLLAGVLIALGASLIQPEGSELVGSAVAIVFLVAALAVAYGADLASVLMLSPAGMTGRDFSINQPPPTRPSLRHFSKISSHSACACSIYSRLGHTNCIPRCMSPPACASATPAGARSRSAGGPARPAEPAVARLPHLTHAAAADPLDQPVAAQLPRATHLAIP